jgi:hypothetical protein
MEEVSGHDGAGLSPQELSPRRARAARSRAEAVVLHDLGDGARRQSDSQFDEFALDTAVAPPWVLFRQALHKGTRLGIHRWPPRAAVRMGPTSSHQTTVPTEPGGWRHRECLSPARPREQSAERCEHCPVGGLVRRTLDLATETTTSWRRASNSISFDTPDRKTSTTNSKVRRTTRNTNAHSCPRVRLLRIWGR